MATLPAASRYLNGSDSAHWTEVVRTGSGVTLCLSPELAKAWSEGLASGLGARAVYLSPAVVAAIKETHRG